MTAESIEQLKARLKKQDEEKEETFQKRLGEIRESQAPWQGRAGGEEAGRGARAREAARRCQAEARERDEGPRAEDLDRRRRNGGRG